MKKIYYHYLLDKKNLQRFFNKLLPSSVFKNKEYSWADDFYDREPSYLIYNIYSENINAKYALRIDCTHMKTYADIPTLVHMCDKVLDDGLAFFNLSGNSGFSKFINKNNKMVKFKDLLENKNVIKYASEFSNSIAVTDYIDMKNVICEFLPRKKSI